MASANVIWIEGEPYSVNHPKVKNYVPLPQGLSDKLLGKKRVRQSQKPLLNKLETEFYEVLKRDFDPSVIYPQAIKWRLGNGIVYTSDFVVFLPSMIEPVLAYEVKGPHAFRGGFENLKVAAGIFKQVKFILCWKDNGKWESQLIKP